MEKNKELKILLVDDLPENLFALSAVFKNHGYKTVSANSGDEALTLLSKDNFGLVLLDVEMPEMNGFELAEKIKQDPLTQSLPIIFLTAHDIGPEFKTKGFEAGGLDYLIKPLNTDLLLLKISNLLKLSVLQQQLKNANRRLAEKAKLSEDTFENFFYSSPDEIFILNEEGVISRINRSGKLSLGVYASELIGKKIGQLSFKLEFLNGIHPDHLHQTEGISIEQVNPEIVFDAIMKNGVKGRLTEVAVDTGAGQIKYYEISGNVFHTADLERFLQLNIREVTLRQKYKSEQEASELRMKEAQRLAKLGSWEIVIEKNEIIWSDEIFRIFELNPDKHSAKYETYRELIHPDDREIVSNTYQNSLINKTPYRLKYRLLFPDGKEKYVEEQCESVFDEAGKAEKSFGTLQDITENELKEKELLIINEKLKEAQRIAKLGSWEVDLVNKKLSWSEEIFRIGEFDLSKNKASYKTFLQTVHPYDRKLVTDTYAQSLISKKPYRIKYRLLFKDGRIKHIEEQCENIYDKNGKATKSTGTVQDITEKEFSAEKIRLSEERFDLAMQGANDGLWDYNVITGEVYFSPRYISMLGYTEEEFGKDVYTWELLLHPDDKERAVNFLNDFIHGKVPEYNQEFRMLHKKGHYVTVITRGIALKNASGEMYRMVGTHSDITEKNKILRQLSDSELFTKGILDSLTSNIAVVDENGWILVTNNSWNNFSVKNGENNLLKTGVGANYFEACQTAYEMGDEISGKVLNGITRVLSKITDNFQIEYPCHAPDRERWFLLTVTPYQGELPRVVVRHIDITERRKTEQKIKLDSEILSGVSDAIIYSDLDLHVIEWNNNATEIFGWSKTEILGKYFVDKLKFYFLNGMTKDNLIIHLIKENKCKIDVIAETKDSRQVYIAMNVSLLKNTDGVPVGIISILHDISERIAYEKALEVSEFNYKELFEQSPFGVITLDTHGRIQSVNDKIAQLTGFSKYKFISKHLLKSPFKITPIGFETREIVEKILQLPGEDFTFEAKIATNEQTYLYCEVKARYLQKIEKVSLIIRDISVIKSIEKFNSILFNITSFANSASVTLENFCWYLKNELANYFNTDNFCVSGYNHLINELEFVYFNDGIRNQEDAPSPRRNFNGLTEYVICNSKPLLLTGNELQHFYRENNIELAGPKAKSWMGVPLITGSNSVGAIAVQSYKNKDEYNEQDLEILVRIAGIAAPIIEKLKNDQKLLLINSAIEGAGEGMFITNSQLENNPIVFANRKYFEITGYKADEVYGNGVEMLYSFKSGKHIMTEIKEALNSKSSFHGELVLKKKNEIAFWSDLTINPVINKEGKVSNFIGLIKDISLKKEMEKLLIEKNKELELFMYRASHDLKGPMSTNKGLLRFAIDECRDHNTLHYLQMMQKSNEKLESILTDLMEIVVIREGTIEKVLVKMDELIKEVIDAKEVEVHMSKDINLVFDIAISEPVLVDVKLLKIILRNIFSNAIKYSNLGIKNPYVSIGAAIENRQLVIKVADNGIGIHQKYLAKVFDMFFRATDSSTGTGLGLYIVKNAIDKIGGTISIDSTEKVGTLVTLKIPL